MAFTREQVTAAKRALGLDPDDTRSVAIYPDMVLTEVVARDDDGVPVIREGIVGYIRGEHAIDEGVSDGGDA